MTQSVDTLIANATLRASNALSEMNSSAADLRALIYDIKALLETSYPTLNLNVDQLAPFERADEPSSEIPIYEQPTALLPDAPTITSASIGYVRVPGEAPTIDIDHLFNHDLPSTTVPGFSFEYPSLNIDALIAEMNAIAKPIIEQYEFPEIDELNISDVPVLVLPEYIAGSTPDDLSDPKDYALIQEEKYNNFLPEMKGFVDDSVSGFIDKYAPEYDEQRASLNGKLLDGLNSQVLPEEYETALYDRAVNRSDEEFRRAEVSIGVTHERRGFSSPPGAMISSINKLKIATADANTNQATELYIKRKEQEVQHLQYVIGVTSQQVQSIRSLAIQSSEVHLGMIQNSINLSDSISNKVAMVFEHQVKRAELMVSVMGALNEQYDSKLRAALSGFEAYKLELESAKLKTDIDIAQINAIESKINAQSINVSLYNSLIDAVTKKADIEELKAKEYALRGDVYKTEIQAQLATFDVFKSAMDGDESKLKGELAHLDAYNSELEAAGTKFGIEKLKVDAINSVNSIELQAYTAGADVYKTEVDAAINRFSAEADVRKLAQQIYLGNLSADIDVHKIASEDKTRVMEMTLKEFVTNTSTLLSQMETNITAYSLIEGSQRAIMDGYSQVATGASNSLNSMVSLAEQIEN